MKAYDPIRKLAKQAIVHHKKKEAKDKGFSGISPSGMLAKIGDKDKSLGPMMAHIGDKAIYGLSLPERTIRSATSILTGVTSTATETLLPHFVKESVTYRVTFGMLQQFLITKIAEIEDQETSVVLQDQYLLRKTAGSVVEGVGLFSVRFSPVWLLAILSDVTGGSKEYLNRLVRAYKREGVIESETTFENFLDLLEGVSRSSKLGLSAFDMPPISKEEFIAYKQELSDSLKGQKDTLFLMMRDLETVWNKMVAAETKEGVPITTISGAMALEAMKKSGEKGVKVTRSTLLTTYEVFHEMLIGPYNTTLKRVAKEGFTAYVRHHLDPHISQMLYHFYGDKETLTEKLIRRAFKGKK